MAIHHISQESFKQTAIKSILLNSGMHSTEHKWVSYNSATSKSSILFSDLPGETNHPLVGGFNPSEKYESQLGLFAK